MSEGSEYLVRVATDASSLEAIPAALENVLRAMEQVGSGGSAAFVKLGTALRQVPQDLEATTTAATTTGAGLERLAGILEEIKGLSASQGSLLGPNVVEQITAATAGYERLIVLQRESAAAAATPVSAGLIGLEEQLTLNRQITEEKTRQSTLDRQARNAAALQAAGVDINGKPVGSGGSGGGGASSSSVTDSGGFAGALSDVKTVAGYLLLYQGFQLLVQGGKDAFDQTVEYDRAVTTLGFALRGTGTDAGALASQLGQIGTAAGLSAADAVNAGKQFILAFPNADATTAGKAGANTAATLNVIGDPKTVGADLQSTTAILTSFNLTVSGSTRVLDAATVSAQAFGQAGANAILPGVAQISDLAATQGFSLEQTTASVAAIIQRTGETSNAAAGELQRFLGREGGNAFQQVFANFGVDTKQGFEKEIAQFAPIFQSLTSAQQGTIVSQLGGGRAGTAVRALLDEWTKIQEVANAPIGGAAAAQEQARLSDLKGLLTTLGGDFKQVALDVGQSGLGDVFGLALTALNPLLTGVDSLLKLFQLMPEPIRGIVVGLGEMAALLAVIGRESAGNLLSGALGLGTAKSAQAAAYATYAPNLVAAGAGAEAGAATAAGGGALAALAPYIAPAILGLLAVGEWRNRADALNRAVDETKTANTSLFQAASSGSANDFRSAASNYGKAAADTPTGFFTSLFGLGQQADTQKSANEALSKFATAEANRISTEQSSAAGSNGSVFGPGGSDITAGFTYLHTAGLSVSQNLTQVSALLLGLASASSTASGKLTGSIATLDALAGAGAQGVSDSFGKFSLPSPDSGTSPRSRIIGNQTQNAARPGEVAQGALQAVQAEADKLKIGSNTTLTPELLDALRKAGEKYAASIPGLSPDGVNKAVKAFDDQFTLKVQGLQANLSQLSSKGGLSADQIAQLADPKALRQFIDDQIKLIQKLNDPGQRQAEAQKLVALAQVFATKTAASGDTQAIAAALDGVNAAQDEFLKIEAANDLELIKHINSKEGKTKDARNKIVSIIGQLVKDAGAAGNTDAVIAALNGLDQASITAITNDVNQQIAAVNAAKKAADLVAAAAQTLAQRALAAVSAGSIAGSLFGGRPGVPGVDISGVTTAAQDALNKQLIDLQNTRNALSAAIPYVDATGSDFTTGVPSAGAKGTKGPSAQSTAKKAGELAAAIIEATAIPGDPLSQASTAARAAAAKMQDYLKGTVEFYGAVKALRDAQYAYATALQKVNADQIALGQDTTNPVVLANEKAYADLQKLRFDKGRGANTVADQLALKQDLAALEKSAFEQKFSDEQTAYQLNQISYQAYLQYLESQHNLLKSIQHKTRDQIDELNQVDSALQSAQAALAGTFNIGAISLPTIYEVRRSIQSTQSGYGYQGGTTNNTIYINGADTAAIERALQNLLGPTAAAVRSPALGRK